MGIWVWVKFQSNKHREEKYRVPSNSSSYVKFYTDRNTKLIKVKKDIK